jgi:hypothetical protein
MLIVLLTFLNRDFLCNHLAKGTKTMNRPTTIFRITVFVCLSYCSQSFGSENISETMIPETLSPGVTHLLELVDPDKQVDFDSKRVAEILNFIEIPKQQNVIYYADEKIGSPSAYYDFDVHRSLEDILKYAFNPGIPAIAMTPSSTRLAHWQPDGSGGQAYYRLWKEVARLRHPIVIKGSELIENTPDTFSGAYYKYDLYRTVVLFKYRHRNVLISISKQKDVSQVGHKGYVLGPDENWDYFYTGKPGLTISGLGWVRSYMYDSYGISIYYEIDAQFPKVRCATFRWVRAGWSGFNVVKPFHIYKGSLRFATAFKEIMESTHLPGVDVLVNAFSKIMNLSVEKLKEKVKLYVDILEKRYNKVPSKSVKWSPKIFEDKLLWQEMSKEEMQSALVVEYMKYVLGKTNIREVGALISLPN